MRLDDLRPLAALRRALPTTSSPSCRRAAPRCAFEPGEELFREGEPADYWWVLLDGALELVRHVGREDTVLGAMDVPGRWAGGFRAWDDARRLPGHRPGRRRRAACCGCRRQALRDLVERSGSRSACT